MNSSPGSVRVICSGDTRLSDDPIQNTLGRWPLRWRVKKSASCSIISSAHARFASSICL
ncbi:hypothetical protein [Sphingomonas sp.]